MDFAYLSSIFSSVLVAIATFPIIHAAPRSLLSSMGVAFGAFSVTFASLFVFAHKREFPLLRCYWWKHHMAKKAKKERHSSNDSALPTVPEPSRTESERVQRGW